MDSSRLMTVLTAFSPGYFAAVMATGIVSIACHIGGLASVAEGLFYLNVALYLVFWGLFVAKLFLQGDEVKKAFADFKSGPSFLTVVAGTCILGTQFAMLWHAYTISLILLALGLLLWFPLLLGFYAVVIHSSTKPSVERDINGSWLLDVVCTQSIPVLGLTFANSMFASYSMPFYVFMVGFHLLGCFLYIPTIILIFYRLLFLPIEPKAFTPPYWICMGSAAISVLAGSKLLIADVDSVFLQSISPFLKGTTLLFWFIGSWCMLLVLLMELWRYGLRKYPIRYQLEYWSMVFPLGMYMVSTNTLGKAFQLDFIKQVAHPFTYIALLVWALTFIGMLKTLFTGDDSDA